jgi:NAD(P)-dependent dehydrogenase (short-subunit alcohol dehydrogenase family)
VSIAQQVEALVTRTVEVYGRLDCAFNNAGVGRGGGRVHEFLEEDWDAVMAIYLKGTWLCMKYEIQQMLKQGGGAIVNDSSMAGLVGYSLGTAYSASKHGIVGLTKSAALQYAADGIRIIAICPGIIPTGNLQSIFDRVPGLEEWALAASPLGRLGTAEEIASAVVWLCSEEASYVTGLAMLVDGGINAGLKPF